MKFVHFKGNNAVQLLLVLTFLLPMQACHVGRYFVWNTAGINDYKKFPANEINRSEGEPFHFIENAEQTKELARISAAVGVDEPQFQEMLRMSKTAAFLVIRNDSMLYEFYGKGYEESSMLTSFSMAKSYVSVLIGMAIEDGFIKSEKQLVGDFLPHFKDWEGGDLTIEHLLNMRSGIEFNEGYLNPFGHIAKYYYGKSLKKYSTRLKSKSAPDQVFDYISVNTQLLGEIVSAATGKSLAAYLQEKIWEPLQMEYDASWSVDSRRNRTEKAFCCLNARANDYAKFGRLMLNNGAWEGKQVAPEDWVLKTTATYMESNQPWYGYQWWHNVKYVSTVDSTEAIGNEIWRVVAGRSKEWSAARYKKVAANDFYAQGILGQFIYVLPEKNTIIVRIGKKVGNVNWSKVFYSIAKSD